MCLFCFVFYSAAFGQARKTIKYSQLAEDIFFSKKDTLRYYNIFFINDLPDKGAEEFLSKHGDGKIRIYGGFKNYLKLRGAKRDSANRFLTNCQSLWFEGCTFENDIRFSNVRFPGSVTFSGNIFPTRCQTIADNDDVGGAILVDSCDFERLQVTGTKKILSQFHLWIHHTNITSSIVIDLENAKVDLLHSTFSASNGFIVVRLLDQAELNIEDCLLNDAYIELHEIPKVNITRSDFTSSIDGFLTLKLDAENMSIHDNIFNANINLLLDKGFLYMFGNSFHKKLAFDYNALDKSSYVHLGSLKNMDFGMIRNGAYFDGTTKEQIEDDLGYRNFIRLNKSLYDFYKNMGHFESANEVYVKIREIEYIRLAIIHEDTPSFKTFFDLNLNRLLKFYTNYGTDPANALVVSLYIILIFGFVYFFFPSDWDVSSKSQIISNFKDFVLKNDKGYAFPFLKMLFGLVISVLNAATLSLNAFTTLGFGNIPTKGLARYICIIQGFIGWFLLSIFTVALINQAQF